MNTALSLLRIKLILSLALYLFYPNISLAQKSSSASGIWDFTYTVEELKMELKGTLTITGQVGRLTGIILFNDMDNASPIYKMNEVAFTNNTLGFLITEGAFAPMKADLRLSDGRLEGHMTLEIPWYDNYKGSGTFIATQQSAGAIVDHAQIIKNLDDKTLLQGKKFYNQVCAACHGTDGTSSLSTARSFNKDEFKFGADPHSMWKTIINGAGQMGAQRWLLPEDAYAVVQYIREELIKGNNPQSYFQITEDYLKQLPKPTLDPEQLEKTIRDEALSGSQQYGQLYYSDHLGNYGHALYSQLKGHASSALTVKLAENIYLSYNVQRMSTSAAWKGSFDLRKSKYQLYRGEDEPMVDGEEIPGFDRMHWSFKDRFQQLENLVSDRTPYPAKWLDFHGHYQYGDNTILSYSIVGREILEMPSAELLDNSPVIQHTFTIAPGDSWRKIVLGSLGERRTRSIKEGVFTLNNVKAPEGLPEKEWTNPENSLIVTSTGDQDIKQFFAAGVQGDTEGMHWIVEPNHQMALFIPPSNKKQLIRVHRFSGKNIQDLENFANFLSNSKTQPIPDPNDFTKGGARLWNETFTLSGQLDVGVPHYDPVHYGKENQSAPENQVKIPENYPYVVDRIPLPFDNPWNSWMRPSGLDFFPDGRLAISTYLGDVWIADGIDSDLDQVKWQRIATGLYDPFGVKIVNGEIYVTCRDRIVRLKDLNGDGETDFYESFFADTDVSRIPVQAFNYSLQTDSKGNFIYSKGGQYTNDDEPGHVIRVTPDGKSQQSLAIGFRAPNGVTIGPKDDIYVSDNQGNWGPANKINLIREGEFYGYIPSIRAHDTQPGRTEYSMRPPLAAANYPEDILPETFEEPIIWLPQEFDNSPGNGAWTPKEWGPLGDRLIHTSFGKGWVYQVLIQKLDSTTQASVSALPFQFDAGIQRARVNPADGQYYVAGITGWDDSFATKYGSLDRIRYTGGEGFFMTEVNVRKNGIEIVFNQKINEDIARQLENYRIEQWNYRWTEQYGSAHWSIRNPEQEGQDTVVVKGVEISENGKKLLLLISSADLQPVDQMRIELSLESESKQLYQDTMYMTIHKVPVVTPSIKINYTWILGILSAVILIIIRWLLFRKKSSV